MITTISILSVLLLVCIYVIVNLLRKVEKLEDTSNNLADFLDKAGEIVSDSNERLQELDARGTFQGDDEVGFFFTNLKELQNVLNAINVNDTKRN